jgi:hypothetical protein
LVRSVSIEAGYGSALATRTGSQILGPTIETEGSSSRKTSRRQRNLQTDPADGDRLSRWRAPRIHGELKMLGISISERTVSRILRSVPRPPSQTWKTFLRIHLGQIVSVDFFIIPITRLRVLFVFLVLEHRRREVLHRNLTEHPTSAWDCTGDCRGFRRSRNTSLSDPRSGWRLWRGV